MSQSQGIQWTLPTQAHPVHQKAVVNCSLCLKTDWLKIFTGNTVIGGVVIEPSDYRSETALIMTLTLTPDPDSNPVFIPHSTVQQFTRAFI